MALRRFGAALVSGMAMAAVVGLGPAAQASGAADVNVKNCAPWSAQRSEGSGAGQICNGNNGSGWVYDKKADGRCPFARFHLAGGGNVPSPHAAPQGTTRNFDNIMAPAGRMFNGTVTIEWFSC